MPTIRHIVFLLALMLSALAPPVQAQPFPSKPLTIVVPYAAGGITDTLARIMAEKLSARLGVSVIVDNKSGAGGLIAAKAVAHAKPDGYTLLMHSTAILAVAAGMPEPRFDPMKELDAVAFVAGLPAVLVVHPSVPAKTVPELLAYIKANPGKLTCGNAGQGATDHLGCIALAKAAGGEIEHLTYKGMPPLDLDLVAGNIQLNVGTAAIQMPLAREGKLRALATAMPVRMQDEPDLPTLIESGVPFDTFAGNALFAPVGTPPEVIARINAEVATILADSATQARIRGFGLVLGPSDTKSLRTQFQRDWDRALNSWSSKN